MVYELYRFINVFLFFAVYSTVENILLFHISNTNAGLKVKKESNSTKIAEIS